MTTFLLLRHALSTANENGVLAGRMEGIDLSGDGRRQSAKLVSVLSGFKIDRIISSPISRCIETISPTAELLRKRININESFQEMDYGTWSGRKLSELRKEKSWKQIQKSPGTFTFPGGESFLQAHRRIERELNRLSRKYPKETILIVTHGDIIKLAIASTANTPLNHFQRYLVDTCSLTEIVWSESEKTLVRSNSTLVSLGKARNTSMKVRKVLGGGSGA